MHVAAAGPLQPLGVAAPPPGLPQARRPAAWLGGGLRGLRSCDRLAFQLVFVSWCGLLSGEP